jgi:hypothetical protein
MCRLKNSRIFQLENREGRRGGQRIGVKTSAGCEEGARRQEGFAACGRGGRACGRGALGGNRPCFEGTMSQASKDPEAIPEAASAKIMKKLGS